MRLHRLTLTAFGPFGGTHDVDFDELSSAGLFLLHGATGAGKTSVLDAVCFALYGGVPGARQQPGNTLRSHHAAPGTFTEVVLELTVGERRLEITRRPEQTRPKLRGSGETREKAQSTLREYVPGSGEWKALSRSHQEIGEEITRLLGMSRDQFCQVVLLPQGDFARFLRAGADDRRKLLSSLFDTGRFCAVEERLNAMRRAAEDEVRAGDEGLLGIAQRMRQAAGAGAELDALRLPGGPDGPPGGASGSRTVPDQRGRRAGRTADAGSGEGAGDGQQLAAGDPGLADDVLEWAALARTHARELRDIAALGARTAETAHAEAATRLEDVRELARRQRQYAEAQRRAAELAAGAEQRDAARARLEKARAAEAVTPALALRDEAATARRDAAAAEHTSRTRLTAHAARAGDGDAPTAEALRDAPPEQLAEWERAAREELGALAAARRGEEKAQEIGRQLAALEREVRADEEALRDADEWLAGWESSRDTYTRRIDDAHDAATRAEQLAAQLEPARQRAEAARRRDRCEAGRQQAEEALLGARERAAQAREHWLDLKDRRLRGFAAELAAALQDGEPCAVCGGTDHPDPARPGEGHIDQAAEDAALAAHQQAESAREQTEQRAAAVREELAGARAESGDESAQELADAAAGLEEEHRTAHTAAADAHAAREALDRAGQEHARRLAQQQEAGKRIAGRTSQRDALQREQDGLTEEVRRARGPAASVAERAAGLEERAALLAGTADAARAAHSAAQRLQEAGARLAEAAANAGFASPQDAADAVLAEHEQQALRASLDQWKAEQAAVTAVLEDVMLAAAAGRPPAGTDAAEQAVEDATRRLRDASAADEAARRRCTELDSLTARAVEDVRRLAPLRERHERTARLAHLAAGTSADNERKMRLETYVLAARLEQVAAAAGARLSHMSAGRYTLVHSDERASGRGRSGLGLHVIDAWTGVERDTATLSGGETFSASLALALGLADVVTDEAGGTRLETLFIDEGFGSLDEQTLDEVLDVLDSLRERDRCVGIVSHVADLRRRIGAQLEVTKSRKGSAVRISSAALVG